MSLRRFVAESSDLVRIGRRVSSDHEAAAVMAALDGRPVLLGDVAGKGRVLGGLCASREVVARAMGVTAAEWLRTMVRALGSPVAPAVVQEAPCQEVIDDSPDLARLPILRHLVGDGGRYITAGVAIIHDPEYGRNACYHRMMVCGPRQCSVRVVEGRGTDTAWRRGDADVPMAVAIGCPLPVLIAAAMSPAKGVDELAIANAMAPTPLVRCRTVPLEVPAEAEIVLEGRLTHRLAPEGPFIDLTETWDFVRQQPVFEIDCITHRHDPIYHAVLPGLSEHKTIMGLPREPGIFTAVGEVCEVRDVKLTRGGMSWLHAVVQIHKRRPDDGVLAMQAALKGHPSVKTVIVVDDDIDLSDDARVEWAFATRAQAGRDLYVFASQPSSSLDPSAKHAKGEGALGDKLGPNATIPWGEARSEAEAETVKAGFTRIAYPAVDLASYLAEGEARF